MSIYLSIFLFCFLLKAFAYLGFLVAVVWIYSVANEIVNILQVSVQAGFFFGGVLTFERLGEF